jgi:Zn-dependent protease with chaperone function
VEPSASAVLPERHLAIAQRVSFVTVLCTVTIILSAHWQSVWILPVQYVALTATTYRARRAMFGETWSFGRYLSWRLRLHVGMFGLWWLVAAAPPLVAQANPAAWWLPGLAVIVALAWHHWSGRVLLVLLRASRLERPDLDGHFQRVFASARVPPPDLWRAGEAGGRLANAFALLTLGQRGVLFFDSLLEQLPADEITAILAHEVAHLEQFHRRRLFVMYSVTTVLILMLMIGSTVAGAFVPAFESWIWIGSVVGVFGAMWLRARRMQTHETDADLRAIELCGDADALIRGLIRIYEINHIPRRWSATAEAYATHPSLARRIRTIRERTAAPDALPAPIERMIVASSEPGRYAVIDHHRVGFLWIDGLSRRSQAEADLSRRSQAEADDPATVLDRADRVEMVAYDQLSELRVSASGGAIALIAVDRRATRWSMLIHAGDVARVQSALDRVDHLVTAPAPRRDLGIGPRTAVLLVVLLAAPFNAIGAVLVPALLALRRPTRPLMLALAAALAGTAIASVNEIDVTVVRIALLGILAIAVLWSVRRRQDQAAQADPPLWTWIERGALLVPVLFGLFLATANARDLFGLHSAIRDRGWFTAALAAMAVFYFVQTGQRAARRAGLGVAIVATASLVIGSPWFLLHAVADPLIADMPAFGEAVVPVRALATSSVLGSFNTVRLTSDAAHFVLTGDYLEPPGYHGDSIDPQPSVRYVVGAFDGWQREIRAYDVAVIDDQRLLVLTRDHRSSQLRAEDMRTGRELWTLTLTDRHVTTMQASPGGRWRAIARRGNQFERMHGQVGSSAFASTRWTVAPGEQSYVDTPRSDGSSAALAVAGLVHEPPLGIMRSDWRETTRLLRVDPATTTELATSNVRVECPDLPIDVSGHVCLSFDGRSTRFWRIDLASGQLVPIAETRHILWKTTRSSQQLVAGVTNGQPVLANLDSQTLVTLVPDQYCWTQDVAVAGDIVVSACGDGATTTVTQFRLPAAY